LVREAARDPRVIAIGEAGLDKTIPVPMDIQQEALKSQVEIALEVDKPLILHCVRSYNEIFSLKSMNSSVKPWIIHWFNASLEMGMQLIRENFYLSFGHMLFNTKSKAYQAFKHIPEHHIFLETDDAEYTIDDVYQQASLLKGFSLSKLESQIRTNFIHCFETKP
jgi:TatD DNase family protein